VSSQKGPSTPSTSKPSSGSGNPSRKWIHLFPSSLLAPQQWFPYTDSPQGRPQPQILCNCRPFTHTDISQELEGHTVSLQGSSFQVDCASLTSRGSEEF
jgi:hypothetical protein